MAPKPVQPITASGQENAQPEASASAARMDVGLFPWMGSIHDSFEQAAAEARAAEAERLKRVRVADAEQKLEAMIANREKLDINTRDALRHLGEEAGIDALPANTALITAANANDHAAMIQSLATLKALSPEPLNSYREGLTSRGEEKMPFESAQNDRYRRAFSMGPASLAAV